MRATGVPYGRDCKSNGFRRRRGNGMDNNVRYATFMNRSARSFRGIFLGERDAGALQSFPVLPPSRNHRREPAECTHGSIPPVCAAPGPSSASPGCPSLPPRTPAAPALLAAAVIGALSRESGNPFMPPATGFVPDAILRKLGIYLVDGAVPGVAVGIGKAADPAAAAARGVA